MENVRANHLKKLDARAVVASVSPSAFNDPLALETEWTALARGGANFKTAKLHQISPTRWEFRSSLGMKLFSSVFLVIGLAVCLVAASKHWPPKSSTGAWNEDFLMMSAFGLLFALVGAGMFYGTSIPTVFDKDHGYFVKNRKKPEHMVNLTALKNYTELKRIHALQLLAELRERDKTTSLSYELNLVLDDGSRLNVIDHGHLDSVRADAKSLGEFLGKPVWDSI